MNRDPYRWFIETDFTVYLICPKSVRWRLKLRVNLRSKSNPKAARSLLHQSVRVIRIGLAEEDLLRVSLSQLEHRPLPMLVSAFRSTTERVHARRNQLIDRLQIQVSSTLSLPDLKSLCKKSSHTLRA